MKRPIDRAREDTRLIVHNVPVIADGVPTWPAKLRLQTRKQQGPARSRLPSGLNFAAVVEKSPARYYAFMAAPLPPGPPLDDYQKRTEEELARARKDLAPLISGEKRLGERRGEGPWLDVTEEWIAHHRRTIATYEAILAALAPGTIIVEGVEYGCVVVDRSETGTRIANFGAVTLPAEFTLKLGPQGTLTVKCWLIWQEGDEAGVTFMKPEARPDTR